MSTSRGRVRALFLFIATAVLIAAPFVLSALRIGEKTIFGCLASDAMYYLAIAKNTARYGFFTFNRETVTNGFQPLWQYILVIFQWVAKPSLANQLLSTFVLNLGLVIVGFTATVSGVASLFGLRVASLMPFLMLPGAFALLFEPSIGHESLDPALLYGFSSWAFVNGMESGASIAALGLLIMSVFRHLSQADNHRLRPRLFSAWTSVWLSAVVLARLDDAFLVVTLALAIVLFGQGKILSRVREASALVLPVTAVVLLFMIYNVVTVGVALPLSGLQKTEVAIRNNITYTLQFISDYQPAMASRLLPMLVFMLVGGAVLIWASVQGKLAPGHEASKATAITNYVVVPLAGYLCLKAVFHFAVIDMWRQGWWYYSGQIFVFNLLAGLLLSYLLCSRHSLYAASLVCMSLVTIVHVIDTEQRIGGLRGYAATAFSLWERRESLNRALLDVDRDMKMIDNTDGLYGFILDMPVASGTGLAFSVAERHEADEKGEANALIDRGFTVLPILSDDLSWQGHYWGLDTLNAQSELIYVDEQTQVSFYRLSRSGRSIGDAANVSASHSSSELGEE